MRLFWELSKVAFQRQITYRAATIAGLATNFFFGLLRAALFLALYGAQSQVAGISITGAITFTGLSQAVIAYLSMFSWYEVMNSVYTGDISSDLLKPMNYFTFWMAQDMGRAVASLLLRGVTLMLLYALVFDISVPQGVAQWGALVLTLTLGWLLSFCWRFIVNLSAFWTPNALGIGRFAFILSWILSGFLIPLRFFPGWFQALAYLTPFPHTVNTIVEVYLGLLNGPQLLQALLAQIAWIIALTAVSLYILRAGVRHLVIQGG